MKPHKQETSVSVFPVTTDDGHARAMARIDELWGAAPTTHDGMELDILLALVAAYEAKRWSIAPPDPLEAIAFRLEQMGQTRAHLAKIVGGESRVSEIFSGKRGLSLSMIRRIHRQLGVPAESLIREARVKVDAVEPGRKANKGAPTRTAHARRAVKR